MDKTKIEILSSVKKSYRNALIKDKKRILAEDNLRIAKDFAEKAGLKQKAGEGTRLELITANMQFNEASINLESVKNEFNSSKNELLILLNTNELNSRDLALSDTLTFVPVELKYDDLLSEALLNSASIKKSGNLLEIASINKTLAWSSLLPNLNFSYYKQAQADNHDFYGFSFGLSVPIWFMFDQRGQIEESAANHSIALAEIKNTKNSLELNLKNAFFSFTYEQAQIKTYIK